jgi:hypothetical protein
MVELSAICFCIQKYSADYQSKDQGLQINTHIKIKLSVHRSAWQLFIVATC